MKSKAIAMFFIVSFATLWNITYQHKNSELIWPEVVTNPDYEYSGQYIKARAIADGFSAWGCASMESPPANFGVGMCKIGTVLGVIATPENLHELAIEILAAAEKE